MAPQDSLKWEELLSVSSLCVVFEPFCRATTLLSHSGKLFKPFRGCFSFKTKTK